jgi:hypothetical protein
MPGSLSVAALPARFQDVRYPCDSDRTNGITWRRPNADRRHRIPANSNATEL